LITYDGIQQSFVLRLDSGDRKPIVWKACSVSLVSVS